MDTQLVRISELKQQILNAGYHSVQLNNIIREVIEDTRVENITFEQSCELIAHLEYYQKFSNKCKNIICKKT